MRLWIAHTTHDLSEDPSIRLRITFNLYGLSDALYTSLSIRESSFFFSIRTSWKNNISKFCSLSHEQLINCEEVQ